MPPEFRPHLAVTATLAGLLLLGAAPPGRADAATATAPPSTAAPTAAAPAAPAAPAGDARVGTALDRAAPAAAPRSRAATLSARITRALAGSTATRTAVAVDVGGLGMVQRRAATVALPPASTQKSFTVLPVLLTSAPHRRLVTQVAAVGRPVRGTQPGPLWLVGGGDPFLTSRQLRDLARRVRASGVARVAGGVVVDDSRYDAVRRNPGWKARWVPRQVGPLSALAVNGNAWRSDAAFLRDPALGNGALFARYLRAEGVRVGGPVRRVRRPVAARTVVRTLSLPMSALAARVLKPSDNFGSELLLKELGRTVGGSGSTAAGLAAARRVLRARGVAVGRAADGSGLSSLDRQSARGELLLLSAAARSPAARTFRVSLAVACGDGTLRRRMCRTPAARRVWAKTGTLAGVSTLAGYTYTADGLPVRFSFLLAGVHSRVRAEAAIDRAVVVLAGR